MKESLAHFEGYHAGLDGKSSHNPYSYKTQLSEAIDWDEGWDSANELMRSECILNGEEIF
jgi:ribosome modulation factor